MGARFTIKQILRNFRITQMTNKYDSTFSIMKGVAIISVVIGHCSIPWIEGFVNQYHLAVFYFIAGYFFNPSYFDTPWIFIKKRVIRLYLPFIGYGFAFLLLHNLFCHWGFYPTYQIYSFSEWLRNFLLLVIRITSSELFMGAMWFPVSLLTVSLLYLPINKIPIINKHKWGGVFFCSIIAYAAITYKVKNPYCIWDTLMILPIYHIGVLFRQYDLFHRFVNWETTVSCVVGMLTIYSLGGIVRFQSSALAHNNLFLFFVVPVMGIVMVYGVSNWIKKTWMSKAVSLCGEYSFEIMAWHFISFKLVAFIHIYLTGGEWKHLSDLPVYNANLLLWTPLYAMVGCTLPLLLKYTFNKVKPIISLRLQKLTAK